MKNLKTETIVEFELMGIITLLAEDQKKMIEGKLNRAGKMYFTNWLNLGKRILSIMGITPQKNEDYYAKYTDVMHEQLHEIRKVLIELKNRENEKK